MRAISYLGGSCLMLVIVACSSAPVSPDPAAAGDPSAPAPAPSAVTYFDGHFDAATREVTLTVRAPKSGLQPQATLPYGNASGSVYFHTCTTAYNLGTHTLSGTVQAVNRTSGSIANFTAVIDSVSLAGVTLSSGSGSGQSSGTIAAYSTVAPNSGDCSSSTAWSFNNPTDASFSFAGHATGDVSGGGSYTVGGSVTGATAGLKLKNNGGDELTLAGNGPFTFATPVANSGSYAVTVSAYPSGQICSVTANGSGTISGANVTNVAVSCFAQPTGGSITTVGGNRIHTFTSGTSSFQTFGSMSVNYLVVAGGGGGGSGDGAGGGAGGVLTGTTTLAATTSTVTVGAGGSGSSAGDVAVSQSTNGSNSVFGSFTAIGGGRGGSETSTQGSQSGPGTFNDGGNGGSGGGFGGANYARPAGGFPAGGAGTTGQGFAGGTRDQTSVSTQPCGLGGGGGAGGVGANSKNDAGGAGGVGISSSISGTPTFYGGGGGGAGRSGPVAAGGNGGGGAGGVNASGTSGTANTGGGGGGGGDQATVGGNGGSGIVIVAYPLL